MKLDMRMDDKPIRIKKGTNWKTLFLTLTFIAVVILAMTSKSVSYTHLTLPTTF